MEPISIILSALASGAVASLKDTAAQAIKDGYNSLKQPLQRRLGGKPDAEMALAKYETEPKVWRAPLEQVLRQSGAEADSNVIEAARKLLEIIKSTPGAGSTYNTEIEGGVQGLVQGDNAQVAMTFGAKEKA
jgi:hypothetical protein